MQVRVELQIERGEFSTRIVSPSVPTDFELFGVHGELSDEQKALLERLFAHFADEFIRNMGFFPARHGKPFVDRCKAHPRLICYGVDTRKCSSDTPVQTTSDILDGSKTDTEEQPPS